MEQIKELAMAMARAYADQERAIGYFYFYNAEAAFQARQQEFFDALDKLEKTHAN